MNETKNILSEKKVITPLWIVALFVSLTETVLGIGVFQTTGGIQIALAVFVIGFPLLNFAAFFTILWYKPYVFYPPTDFAKETNVGDYVEAMQHRPIKEKLEPITLPAKELSQSKSKQKENSETVSAAEISDDEKTVENNIPINVEKATEFTFSDILITARETRDLSKVSEVYEKIQLNETDEAKKLDNQILFLFSGYELGESHNLDKLKKLAQQEDAACSACSAIGAIYARDNNVNEAIKYFQLSIKHCKDEETITKRNISIANILHKTGKSEDACIYLLKVIKNTQEAINLANIYTVLASFYKSDNEKELATLALEKALELEPSKVSILIDLAYIYSELNRTSLSQLYYNSVLSIQPQNTKALHNSGVNYDNLGLPIHCVDFYKKAITLNHSLSVANMAYRLINAGFISESSDLLEANNLLDNAHPNVASAIADTANYRERENQSIEILLKDAVEEQQYYRNYAKGYFNQSDRLVDLSGTWEGKETGEISITQTGDKFEFTYPEEYLWNKIEGKIINFTAKVTKFDRDFQNKTTVLFVQKEKGYAYITDSVDELSVFIFDKNEKHLINLKRIHKPKEVEPLIALTAENDVN